MRLIDALLLANTRMSATHRRHIQAYVTAIIVLVVATVPTTTQDAPTPLTDSEAYAVYAALLPSQWPLTAAHAKLLVFQRETGTGIRSCFPSGKILEEEWRPVVDSYNTANANGHTLLPMFSIGLPYEIVPQGILRTLITQTWEPFYGLYPESGGFIEVSAVGFDQSKTRAMVYMAHHCGPLCGGGTHYFLQKRDGQWVGAQLPIASCTWAA